MPIENSPDSSEMELAIIAAIAREANTGNYKIDDLLARVGLRERSGIIGILRAMFRRHGYVLISCLVYCPEEGNRKARATPMEPIDIDILIGLFTSECPQPLWMKFVRNKYFADKGAWIYNDLRIAWKVCTVQDVERTLEKIKEKYPEIYPLILDRTICQ